MWVPKGVKHVQTSLKEDKRQYTGDVCVNAVGDVVAVHAIFAGKTEKSLPSLQVRNDPRLAHFKFSVTTNHWLREQDSLSPAVAERRVEGQRDQH